MGATPGTAGTALAHAAWLPVLRTLGTQTWFGPRMYASNASKVFDSEGRRVDETARTALAKYLRGFSDFVACVGRSV
jgi:chromate reductase